MKSNYAKLFESVKIGTMTVENRMIVPSMVTNYCNHDGTATPQYLQYHKTKAEGGWGLIITEAYKVTETCGGYYNMAGLWNDAQIKSHTELTDTVHKAGSKIVCQLIHGGRQVPEEASGVRAIAPSAIKDPTGNEVPKEMTLQDINDIKQSFVDAAVRAKSAGFDGVEIHGAHGYLLNQFLSAFSNKRADAYGGTITNRARIVMEIIEETRAAVGADYPIILRLTTMEYVEGGITLQESELFAKMAEQSGADAIHATQGVYKTGQFIIPPCAVPAGSFQDNAASLKKVVSIPIIAVGRINSPEIALGILEEGKADLVAMGRASLADPNFPNKLKQDKENEIIRCIGCVQGCIGGINRGSQVSCLVNPRTGRELEYALTTSADKKKVMVIGGGISGMEAAISAANRGHEVALYEQSEKLGGQWLAAAVPPSKAEFNTFVYWQVEQLKKLGVQVHTNTACSLDDVKAENPDTIIVATGGSLAIPPIKGVDSRELLSVADVLLGKKEVNGNVVVIGGGLAGAETAEHLCCHGYKVSVVEMLDTIAKDGEATANIFMMENFHKNNVDVYTGARVLEVKTDSVLINLSDGSDKKLQADTVIMATGTRSYNPFGEALQALGKEVFAVGDAARAKNGLANIAEGYKIGYYV